MGTIAKKVHALPGTTFSNIQQKGEYDSAAKSAISFDKLYRWLIIYIVNDYHLDNHRGIDMPPIQKWRDGILGNGRKKGIGLPEPIQDTKRFAITLLPSIERTVQRNGIVWDKIHYWSDSLRLWIDNRKGKTKENHLTLSRITSARGNGAQGPYMEKMLDQLAERAKASFLFDNLVPTEWRNDQFGLMKHITPSSDGSASK